MLKDFSSMIKSSICLPPWLIEYIVASLVFKDYTFWRSKIEQKNQTIPPLPQFTLNLSLNGFLIKRLQII